MSGLGYELPLEPPPEPALPINVIYCSKCPDRPVMDEEAYLDAGGVYYYSDCLDNMSPWDALGVVGVELNIANYAM